MQELQGIEIQHSDLEGACAARARQMAWYRANASFGEELVYLQDVSCNCMIHDVSRLTLDAESFAIRRDSLFDVVAVGDGGDERILLSVL